MQFVVDDVPMVLEMDHLVIAGWTGRDSAAIRHHIDELAALGVNAPSKTPLYYRVSAGLLTSSDRIEAVGDASSGEAEPLIIQAGERRWLGLGSDHTDRALETYSVAMSKQVCAKPCAIELWPWEQVVDHLEEIQIESWVMEDDQWVLYQQGKLASILPLTDLLAGSRLERLAETGPAAMMCGTFGAKGGIRPAARFRMCMTDPINGRSINHEYSIETLPVIA